MKGESMCANSHEFVQTTSAPSSTMVPSTNGFAIVTDNEGINTFDVRVFVLTY